MQKLVLAGFLAVGVVAPGWAQVHPLPVDNVLLGQWRGERVYTINYGDGGRIISERVDSLNEQLLVTPSRMIFTNLANASSVIRAYQRIEESLLLEPKEDATGYEAYFIRHLTDNSFTFEFRSSQLTNQPYFVQTVLYHRQQIR